MSSHQVPPFNSDLDIIIQRPDSGWMDIGIGLALVALGFWLALGRQ